MVNETSLTLKICDKVVKYTIYAVIFLVPIFFLPQTTDVLDFNKQALLIFLGFIALFAWMIKALILGKIEVNTSKINIAVGALFLAYLLANIFSVNKYGSFWGWPQITSESLLSLIGLAIFYFLVSSTFSRKNIFTGVVIFSVSAFSAQLSSLFNFNTIGSAGALGFFTAILLPVVIAMIFASKSWLKVFFALHLVLSALVLFLLDYSIVWWVVALGAVVLIIFGALKKDVFDGRLMALPMFFLVVALFFIFFHQQISYSRAQIAWLPQQPSEVFLSQKASYLISLQAVKERPVLGSGPGTFSYDFLKFKDPKINQSALPSIVFNQAGSKVLTDFATTGILGIFALLLFIIFPIFYGAKFVFSKTADDLILTLGVLAALSAQALMYFLYNSNFVLNFLSFFLLAGLAGLVVTEKKQYEIRSSALFNLTITFIFTLVFIFGLGLLVLEGQRYVAETKYHNGLVLWQLGDKEASLKSLLSSVSLNRSSDLYFRELSRVFLLLLKDELQNPKTVMNEEENKKIQDLWTNSLNSAVIATNLNPNNAYNWSNKGYIYQSLSVFIGDISKLALESYDQALKLDPNNPYLFLQKGVINFGSARLNDAKDDLEKAVDLNPNYSNALYYLGLVYDGLGQKAKAVVAFTKVGQLNPDDKTIPKILSNLKAGLPALQQAPPVNPAPPE